MSLTHQQKAATINEFARNIELLGLSPAQIAHDLDTTEQHVNEVARLRSGVLEEPWVLRNYLLSQAARAGIEPVPFTALVGDHHSYWFLDADASDRGLLG